MLELRPNCECCDADLPGDSPDVMICSFECTFCAECADQLDDRARMLEEVAPHDALQLLHIVQEALTNVVKHARASTVTVRIFDRSIEILDTAGQLLRRHEVSTQRGTFTMT